MGGLSGYRAYLTGYLPNRYRFPAASPGYAGTARSSPLHQQSAARGHEFHYSSLDPLPASVPRVYRLRRRRADEREEGYLIGNALLSHVHLHFASNPRIAGSFVRACAEPRTT